MPSWLGGWEIAIVVVIALLVFGPKKLPDLGHSLGKSISGFRKGLKDSQEEVKSTMADVKQATGVADLKAGIAEVREATGLKDLKDELTFKDVRDDLSFKDLKQGFSLKDEPDTTPPTSETKS